jgi:hypothetical protein
MGRVRKIAIVGARGLASRGADETISCTPWERLDRLPNLRDQDVVVFNLLEPPTVAPDWTHFHSKMDAFAARDVLLHDGFIVVLGNPRFLVPMSTGPDTKHVPFLDWAPIAFSFEDGAGDTVELSTRRAHEAYSPFLASLKRWHYSIASAEIRLDVMTDLFKPSFIENMDLTLDVASLALNRYRNTIAGIYQVMVAPKTYRTGNSTNARPFLGPIILLPPTSLPPSEALLTVLRDVCGADVSGDEPEWIASVPTATQAPLDEAIASANERMAEISADLTRLEAERVSSRRVLGLLYETGAGLEAVVIETLQALGAHVEVPEHPGDEDGWIEIDIAGASLRGVLEIKSTSKPTLDEYSLKQAVQWQQRGVLDRDTKYTPIVVALAGRETPPQDRVGPFTETWRRKASALGVIGIACEDLYRARFLDERGELNRDDFWLRLFSAGGAFDATLVRQQFDAMATKAENPWGPAS